MKNAILAILCSLVLAGCSESPKPLDSGTPISGTVWKYPPRAQVNDNAGAPIPHDARVDVFENVIIIHLADGSRQIVPLDYVSDLKLK